MPSAVHEEMSMAYALKKPTLIIIEENVKCDGFIANLGTFIKFDRSKIYTTEFIKKTISSIHQLRLQAVEQNYLLADNEANGYYAERASTLIELLYDKDKPKWHYISSRKLIFTRLCEGQIKNGAWADYVPEDASEKIDYRIRCSSNRGDIKETTQVIKNTTQQLEIGIIFDPQPQKDDSIEIDFFYASPYFNPVLKSQTPENKRHHIGGKTFDCFDGMIPIQPTREMHLQFRFPDWYTIDLTSIFPFVGSYSGGVDYIVESEIKRCTITNVNFGGSIQIDIKIESPIMRHVYGVAWNLK